MKLSIYKLAGFLVLTASLILFGCKKDEVAPTVTVDGVSVASAYGGDLVTIQGSNLQTVKSVFVGNKHAELQGADEASLSFVVPLNAVAGATQITLAMRDGYRVTTEFEVLPAPLIFTISPSAAAPGETITIGGANLDELTSATIGGMEAVMSNATSTSVELTVPDGLELGRTAEIEVKVTENIKATSTSIFYVGTNYIANSAFEEGSGDEFTDWEKLNGGDRMTEVTGNEAYFGRSMRVVGAAGNPWDSQLASLPTELTFGAVYTVMIWARAEAPGAVMRVSASQFDGNGADYFYGDDVELATEWTQYTWEMEVTADLPTHKLLLDMGTTDVPFLIDNITLVETGAGGGIGAPNLAPNPGFEDGLTGWESLNGAHEATAAEALCGTMSMTATGAGANPWDVQIATEPMDLVEGTDYEIGFWAKAAGADGFFRISMSQYDGNGSDFFYSDTVFTSEEWTYYGFVVNAANVPSGEYRLLFDMGHSTQTFFVDEVSVREYQAPADNLAPNGGFEDGLTGWNILNGGHEASTAESRTDAASLTATGTGGNPWDVQLASDPMDMIEGNEYKISFWAKAAGPDGVFRISMSQYDGNGSDFFYSDDLNIPEEWTFYTFVVTAANVPSGEYRLLFDMGATTQTFFVDDVSVVEYERCN